MIAQLALVLAVFAAWLYIKWSKVKRYWADRGVPHEPPHPIQGSMTFMGKENMGIWIKKLYQRFPTPYVGIWIFWKPALVIQSPELARRVLVKDSHIFNKRTAGSGSAETDPIGGLNIFSAQDPFWSKMRRRLTPLFTSSKLKSLHELISTKSSQLTSRIKDDTVKNKPIELRNTFVDFTTDLITISSFGIESDAVNHGVSPTRNIVQELMTYNIVRSIAWICIFFLPEVVGFFKFKIYPKTSMTMLRKMYSTVIKDRGGYNNISNHNDLIDVLRKIKYEANQKGEELSEDALVAQSAVFLQAGFDTSGTTLSFTTLELAHNPEIQQKLYEELSAAKEKLGDKNFDESVLSELPYLNACIKETIRKFIPMGWLDRVAAKDYEIDDKVTIPAGTTIYVNSMGMHYDPKYFPEPEVYKPERFLPENEKNIVPFSYLPFGDGPRFCIGKRFAQMALRYGLSNLILNFEIKPKPGTKKPNEYEVDKMGLLLAPGEPLYVDFIPRK